jgi:hypothetical protein
MRSEFILLLILLVAVSVLFVITGSNSKEKEIVLGLSEFEVTIDETGKQIYSAKNARLLIIHPDENWRVEEISNPDSNVAHKGAIGDVDNDGFNELVGIGGQNATMKVYSYLDSDWQESLIWSPDCIRVRDVEIGDVDNDGLNEIVAGTHTPAIIGVFNYIAGKYVPTYVDNMSDNYIHEVEVGDIDSDGFDEIFATVTEPNRIGAMPGMIMEYKWNGVEYDKITVENNSITNAKEIVSGDVDNDDKEELIAIFGCVSEDEDLILPVQVKKYEFEDNVMKSEVIFNITDVNISTCFITDRSAAVGDVDNDGLNELVIGTHNSGIYILSFDTCWNSLNIDQDPTAGIHAVRIGDFDGDGLNELVSASDGAGVLRIHNWNGENFETADILETPEGAWVWEIDWEDADNI